MGLALSTSWNAFRYEYAEPILNEIKSLGFEEIELSFNLTSSIVKDIAEQVEADRIRVTSLHNFCPIPLGLKREEVLPDYYSLSSVDRDQRFKAIERTKNTIDTASLLGAKAVVLHCGRIEITDRTKELADLYEKGEKYSETFARIKQEAIKERQENSQQYLDNIYSSLEVLNKHAVRKNVLLGIETRYYYREIPSLEEIGLILQRFSGSQIFYWHDTGHAQVMENLGFASHKEYLDRYKDSLIGIHLHNLFGCHDHWPPSKGDLDFNFVSGYLKNDTIKVIEAHQQASSEDIIQSRQLLEKVFYGRL